MCYAIEGDLCDEHLMQVRLSTLLLPEHLVCLPFTFGQSAINYKRKAAAEVSDGNAEKTSNGIYCTLISYVEKYVLKGVKRQVRFPLCDGAHWGVMSVHFGDNGAPTVQWEDYLMVSASRKVLGTVRRLVLDAFKPNAMDI